MKDYRRTDMQLNSGARSISSREPNERISDLREAPRKIKDKNGSRSKNTSTMSRDELRARRQARARYIKRKKRIRNIVIASIAIGALLIIYFLYNIFSGLGKKNISEDTIGNIAEQIIVEEVVVDAVEEGKSIYGLLDDTNPIPQPEINIDHLPINEFSRPGLLVNSIDHIVVHYVGNPKTTAEQNRSYYEQIIATMEASVSSNYVVGLDGKIIECVPSYEVAYASNSMNRYSVSIEASHPDESGSFYKETYDAMVELTAWLCGRYELTSEDLLRHYDITGKECPKSFVDNPGEWTNFKSDVQAILDQYS